MESKTSKLEGGCLREILVAVQATRAVTASVSGEHTKYTITMDYAMTGRGREWSLYSLVSSSICPDQHQVVISSQFEAHYRVYPATYPYDKNNRNKQIK